MTESTVERIARLIDPSAFKHWQSMYDYSVMVGDTEEVAKNTADWSTNNSLTEARRKAHVIAAEIDRLRAERDEARAEVERLASNLLSVARQVPVRFADPPDGGDVPLAVLVQRMRLDNETLREALRGAATTMRVAVGAIQTGQIIDKDTEGSLMRGWKDARATLQPTPASGGAAGVRMTITEPEGSHVDNDQH